MPAEPPAARAAQAGTPAERQTDPGSCAERRSLSERLAARIRERGPIPVSEFIEAALYDPDGGFYTAHGRAGRRGDFLTAPEIGPLFGAVLARALGAWRAASRDHSRTPGEASDDRIVAQGARRFQIVELGAGSGALARSVLAAIDDAGGTSAGSSELRWWAVEASPSLRGQHQDHPAVRSVASLDDLEGLPDVILANELLDNIAFDVIERADYGWREVLVGLDDSGRFAESLGLLVQPPTVSQPAEQAADEAPAGVRLPVQQRAVALLRDLRSRFPQAHIVVFDYAAGTAELLERSPGWLRCYAGHARLDDWLSDPGSRDITCDLAIEQIAAALDDPPTVTSQADWLRSAGIDDLVAEGRRVWEQRAHLGDMTAMLARSRVREADALTDPAGLGGFTVFDWDLHSAR